MFPILQKSSESVTAEDLENLQNEIERRLVSLVTQKWELEQELHSNNNASPDPNGTHSAATPAPSIANSVDTTAATIISNAGSSIGKQTRNIKLSGQIELPEDANDGSSLFDVNNGASSADESPDGSISSESSLISSLTGSTIITANLPDSKPHSVSSFHSNKRSHRQSADRPSKRFRPNNSNSLPSSSTFPPKRSTHTKHRSKIVPSKFRNSAEDFRHHKKQVLKNEAPDKLWPFVEQFCATPTEEQIKELEEMIELIDGDKDYFRIPPLTAKESAPSSKNESPNAKGNKKSKTKTAEDESGLGALTQRLVSSFIEDSDDAKSSQPSKSNNSNNNTDASANRKKNSKSRGKSGIDITNAKNLEKRIRQELEEHDILDQQDEIPYNSEDDEVLRELIASQHELLTIQRQNKEYMSRLMKSARKHVELEAEREKLREANADVIAAYQKLIQAKQRKRSFTKKERDTAWKALKTQDAIFKRCDELYLSNRNRNPKP